MAVKTILTEPNNILRKISKPVENVGESERLLMDDMLEQCMPLMAIGLRNTNRSS